MEIRITKAQTTLFVPINKLPGVSLFDYITLLRCYKRPLLIEKIISTFLVFQVTRMSYINIYNLENLRSYLLSHV